MQFGILKWVILPVSLILTMCGTNPSRAPETTVASTKAIVVEEAPPPSGKLDVSVPDTAWRPAVIGDNKGASLISALGNTKNVVLLLPKKLPDAEIFETRVVQMLKAASPGVGIVAKGEAPTDKLIEIFGDIPYHQAESALAADADGRIPTIAKTDPLNIEWLSKKKSLNGADAIFIVRPIQIKTAQLNEMRSAHVGDCDEFENNLKDAIIASANYFKPYESWAFERLRREFAVQLTSSLALWRSELQQASATARPGSSVERCIDAYRTFLSKYEVCFNGPCKTAPRVFSAAGGILGMIDESGAIPDSCPTEGMRDFPAEMRKLGERTMYELLPSLKGKWTDEFVRQSGLETLLAGMKDVCAPRHRRIDEDKLTEARAAVENYLKELKDGDFPSEWDPSYGKERVVGIGPVDVLARVRPLVSNPSARSINVIRELRAVDRCVKGTDRPIQTALIDVATSQILYMGIFFEEALLCEDLPPR